MSGIWSREQLEALARIMDEQQRKLDDAAHRAQPGWQTFMNPPSPPAITRSYGGDVPAPAGKAHIFLQPDGSRITIDGDLLPPGYVIKAVSVTDGIMSVSTGPGQDIPLDALSWGGNLDQLASRTTRNTCRWCGGLLELGSTILVTADEHGNRSFCRANPGRLSSGHERAGTYGACGCSAMYSGNWDEHAEKCPRRQYLQDQAWEEYVQLRAQKEAELAARMAEAEAARAVPDTKACWRCQFYPGARPHTCPMPLTYDKACRECGRPDELGWLSLGYCHYCAESKGLLSPEPAGPAASVQDHPPAFMIRKLRHGPSGLPVYWQVGFPEVVLAMALFLVAILGLMLPMTIFGVH